MNFDNQAFKDYLKRKGFTDHTIYAYSLHLLHYFEVLPNALDASYAEVISYMEGLSKAGLAANTKTNYLGAIKKLYDFLIETGQRDTHPCRTLFLKGGGKRNVIQGDLFSRTELESLLTLNAGQLKDYMLPRYQVILSLMIYQALLPCEIIRLKMDHVNVDGGSIYIKGGQELSPRRIGFHPRQRELFEEYLNTTRKKLLRGNQSDYFLINYQGRQDRTIDGVTYLVENLKPNFQDRNLTTTSIRDSTISYWINERNLPLEQAQLLAGHRWISSTQRYVNHSTDKQREIMNQFHPLGK